MSTAGRPAEQAPARTTPARGRRPKPAPRLDIRPHRFMPDLDGDCWCNLLATNRHHIEPEPDELSRRVLGEREDDDQ